MTTDQLRKKLNEEFGMKSWPLTYRVDAETYANVCQSVFEKQFEQEELYWDTVNFDEQKSDVKVLSIAVGKINRGIMFKGVELVLARDYK